MGNLKIFVKSSKKVNANELKEYSKLDEEYKHILNDNCENDDIKFAFKKLGVKYDLVNSNMFYSQTQNISNEKHGIFSNIFKKMENAEANNYKSKEIENISNDFNKKKYPNIQKWRSTEVNLTEYLRYFDFIDEVKDVSVSNLGYDIEVKLKNGEKIFIEVKSVISFSQPFKITNNEYTCAHNYGDKYYIALVINDDNFEVKFIQNPIENLHFEKKCEQWSWFCEEYKSNLLDIDEI